MKYQRLLLYTTFQKIWKASIILILGLILTIVVSFYIKRDFENHADKELQFVCSDIQNKIDARLHAHAQLLRCGAALFGASDSINREEWKSFYDQARITKNLPGILGLGYTIVIPKNQLQQHIQCIRKQGFPDYDVKTNGERSFYTSIIYLEPFAGRNLRAFGYDMFSEPIRRKAMEISRDSNRSMLSGKVTLVQETNTDVQAGTLMYVPVYEYNKPIATVEQRRAAIKGWVYSPFRMNDLMAGILGRWDIERQGRIHLKVYDGDCVSDEQLLFDSQRNDTIKSSGISCRTVTIPVEYNSKKWTLIFTQKDEQVSLFQSRSMIVLVCGFIISILLFILFLSLLNLKSKAQQIAEQLTVELKEGKERFQTLLNSSAEAIYGIDLNGCCTFSNRACVQVLGYSSPEQLLGKNMHDQIHHSYADGKFFDVHDCKIFKAFIQGIGTHVDDEVLWRSDGTCFPAEYWSYPIFINGVIEGAVVSFFDISERKQTEQALKESEERWKYALDGASNGVWDWNIETNKVYYSTNWKELLGLSGQIITDNLEEWRSRVHPDDLQGCLDALQLHISGKTLSYTNEYRILCYDNSFKWVLDRGKVMVYDENGKPLRMIGTITDITDRKKAEELLLQTRTNYETFFNTIDDFLFVLDQQGNIIHTNNTVTRRLEYTAEELLGQSVLKIHPLDRRAEAGRIVGEMLDGKAVFCPVPILTKSGVPIPVETRVAHGFWDGKPVIFGVTKDISQVRLSEEKFSKLFYINPSACGLSDLDTGKYLEVNDVFYSLLGFDENEVIGKTATELGILSDETKRAVLKAADANGNVYNIEADIKAKNGAIKHVLLSSENFYIQDKKYKFTVVHDITARKIAEEALLQASTRLSLATRAGGVGVWDFDLVNNNLIWDDQMYALYGITKESFNGAYQAWIDGLHPDEVARGNEEIQMAIRGEKEFDTEFRVCWPDGSVHNIRAMAIVQRDDAGNALHLIGTNWDITEQKRAEEALVKSKKDADSANKAKSEFLANMSHEIRTPMNAILGFSEALYHKLDSEQHKKMVKSIVNGGNLLMSLLNDILDLSKIEAGKLDISLLPVNFNSLLQEILSLFREKASLKGLELNFTIESEFPEGVLMDEIRVKQVLFNLVGNAIKFTHKGYVNIKLSFTPTVESMCQIKIEVEDTGIGIPESQYQIVFEAFRQQFGQSNREYGGTGLGLAITKRLVEKMNGSISVNSVVGRGSSFIVTFPQVEICNIKPRQIYEYEVIENVIFEKATILIVDDVVTNIEAVQNQLLPSALTILTAENGYLALDILKNSDPDLVLLDMRMPGIDGYEVAKRIKSDPQKKHIAVIAYTASVLSSDVIEKSDDFDGFLYKPVRRVELFNELKKFLKYTIVNQELPPVDFDFNKKIVLEKETIDQLPEIVKILNEKFIPEWATLIDNYVLFKIEAFIDELKTFAHQYQLQILVNYTNQIKDDLEMMNLDHIKKNLYEFPEIIKTLTQQIKS